MAELLIAAESIVTAAQPGPVSAVLSPGYVLIEDGWITAVGEGEPPRTPDEHLDHGVHHVVEAFLESFEGFAGFTCGVAAEGAGVVEELV